MGECIISPIEEHAMTLLCTAPRAETSQGRTPLDAVQVAECCVEALFQEDAQNTVVELIADRTAPPLTWGQLFAAAKWPAK
jgi:hypothetical protein